MQGSVRSFCPVGPRTAAVGGYVGLCKGLHCTERCSVDNKPTNTSSLTPQTLLQAAAAATVNSVWKSDRYAVGIDGSQGEDSFSNLVWTSVTVNRSGCDITHPSNEPNEHPVGCSGITVGIFNVRFNQYGYYINIMQLVPSSQVIYQKWSKAMRT